MTLPFQAAAWVDAQLTPYLHKTSFAAQDRLVAEALKRFDPARARAEADAAEDRRAVKISHDQVTFWGTSYVTGELDLADAQDLEAAAQAGAERLKSPGSTNRSTYAGRRLSGRWHGGELTLDEGAPAR